MGCLLSPVDVTMAPKPRGGRLVQLRLMGSRLWVDRERGLASRAEDGRMGDGTKWCLYLMGGRQKANGSNWDETV